MLDLISVNNILYHFFYLQEECFEALESISRKINNNDADLRGHVILSMIKVAATEADVPDLPPSAAGRPRAVNVFTVLLVTLLMSTFSTRTIRILWRKCFYCWTLSCCRKKKKKRKKKEENRATNNQSVVLDHNSTAIYFSSKQTNHLLYCYFKTLKQTI